MKKMILLFAGMVVMTCASMSAQANVLTQFGWSGEINASVDTNIFLETAPSFVTPTATDVTEMLRVKMADLQLIPLGGGTEPPVSFDFAQSVYEDGFNIYTLLDPSIALVTGDIDLTGQTLDVLITEAAGIFTAITDITLHLELTQAGLDLLANLGPGASADVLTFIDNNPDLRFNLSFQTTQNGTVNTAELINTGLLGDGATYSATAIAPVAIPEPASLSVLALGALAVSRRRRKG